MKDIGLVHVNVDGVVFFQCFAVDVILDGSNVVVDKQLLPVHVAGEAPDPVIHRDDIRIEAADEIIQRAEGCYFPAGGHVDIHPEGRDGIPGMIFREGVDGDVALIQMGDHGVAVLRQRGVLGEQEGYARSLGIVILLGNIQHGRADHLSQVKEDVRETLGVILSVDIGNVVLLSPFRLRVAHVVDVEAQ
ncbi:hypothetical protein SDC9_47619 [bioreactor metagenome]|uniref:Uncharacterized protein n=1 Tax=bioreactor metagenome TaxID=1076179 RepID=A0A644WCR0_9ZZZZ